MNVRFTDNFEEYAATVSAYLERDPVRNTVPLGVIANVRAGLIFEAYVSWLEDSGTVVGTASWTPPFELLLSVMEAAAAEAVADAWAYRDRRPNGVVGPRPAVDACATRFAHHIGADVHERFAERLFRLDAVHPVPQPDGLARPARSDEEDLCVEWFEAFVNDAGVTRSPNVREQVRGRMAHQWLWLWERNGEPVSMVAHQPAVAGVTRLGPIYTPRDLRGQGYGRALTAAVSQHRLDSDDLACCLFTDLANPVSNAIYQQIGYQPVGDYAQLELLAR